MFCGFPLGANGIFFKYVSFFKTGPLCWIAPNNGDPTSSTSVIQLNYVKYLVQWSICKHENYIGRFKKINIVFYFGDKKTKFILLLQKTRIC